MSRRLAAVGLALALLALVGAGAFGGVFASDTTGSGLAIDAADGPNGAYADLSGDRLMLDLAEGGGVSNDAITRLDAVFVVTNDRSYAAPVWVSDNSSALSFYDSETGAAVDSREGAKNLTAGESLVVGVSVDTRGVDAAEIESTSGFTVETLVKDASGSDPTDSPDASDAPDPSDAPDTSTPAGTSDSAGTSTATATQTGTATRTESGGGGSGGGGGGGGGGGQTGGSAEPDYSVYDTAEGATVNVRESPSSTPFTADLVDDDDGTPYVDGESTDVTAFASDLTFDRSDWRVEITNPTAEPQDAPAIDGDAVSYFRADAYQVEASAFDRITVNTTVSVPDDADASDVAFYRHTDDGWTRVDSSHLGDDRFSADVGGFGELAVVVEESGTDDGTSDSTNGGTDDGTNSGTTDGTSDGTSGDTSTSTAGGESGSDGTTATASGTESGNTTDTGETASATAVERMEEPLRLNQGLGGPTIVVLGAFSLWLAARGRVGRGGGGL